LFILFQLEKFSQWGTANDLVEKFTKYFGGAKMFGFEIPKDQKSDLVILF
jgi:hypothetical protein